ncbi:hypothetical protein BGZ94_007996 [Podila epigama]|nr:hypothetical protein BGZ94_007996 [Podila epigama]
MSDITATTTPVVAVEEKLQKLSVTDQSGEKLVATTEQKKLTILDDLDSDDDSDDEDYVANDDSDSDDDEDDSSSSSSDEEDSDKEDEIEGDELAALAKEASEHGATLDVEKKVLRTGKVIEVTTTSTEVAVEETVVKAEASA